MNTYEIYALIAIVAIVGTGVVFKLFPSLRIKLFKDGEEVIKDVESVIPVVDKGLTEAQKVLPNNATINALAELREWIKIGVGNSEEDTKNGKITKGQRFDNAKALAESVATGLGIELDEKKEMQISAAINHFCNELGHAPTDVKAIQDALEKAKSDLLNSQTSAKQLEADKTAVLNELTEVKKQKDEVVAQLNVIKGAVGGIQATQPVQINITNPETKSSITVDDNGVTAKANNINIDGQVAQPTTPTTPVQQ